MPVQRPLQRTDQLKSLLVGVEPIQAGNALLENFDVPVSGLELDSRQVKNGNVFVALQGETVHGLSFVREAVAAGAIAVLYESAGSEKLISSLVEELAADDVAVPLFEVVDLSDHLGEIASKFYGAPSKSIFVIGITGTNGKTSCSHFLAQALSSHGSQSDACGVIGTLGYGAYGDLKSGQYTTPDALKLHSLLATFSADERSNVVMEVSSHALEQGRVGGVAFDMAVFTNLSHDHLDYHGDFFSYAQAKRRLFQMPGLRYAVVNCDDEFGRELLESLPENLTTLGYGVFEAGFKREQLPDVYGKIVAMNECGVEVNVMTPMGEGVLRSSLLGRFNVSNLLAVLAVMLLMKMPLKLALQRLSETKTVAGRMERFGGGEILPLVVVDFAHTPDALLQVLQTLRSHCLGNLWCVFGCGGDRDRSKRSEMGAIAERCAEQVIITDDNPRHEDARKIIEDIIAGMTSPDAVQVLPDRAEAIEYAVTHAVSGDVVLIAGKGHEEYQLVGDEKLQFSDRNYVNEVLKEVA